MRRVLMTSMIVAGLAASTPAAATSTSTPDRQRADDRVERLADRLEHRADRLYDRVTEQRYTGVDVRAIGTFEELAFASFRFWARIREDGEFHHSTIRAWNDLQRSWVDVQQVMRLSRATSRVRNAYVDAAEEMHRLDVTYGAELRRLERERHRGGVVEVRVRDVPSRAAVVRRRVRDRGLDVSLRIALPGLRVRIGG